MVGSPKLSVHHDFFAIIVLEDPVPFGSLEGTGLLSRCSGRNRETILTCLTLPFLTGIVLILGRKTRSPILFCSV